MAASGPPYADLFDGESFRSINDDVKMTLLTSTWDLAHQYAFPARFQTGNMRKFNSRWLLENKWLRYSVSNDGVYCGPCRLFCVGEKSRVLVTSLQTDWSNITKVIGAHKKSTGHLDAMERAENFIAIHDGKQRNILSRISSDYNMLIERNRQILTSIVETIILCGKQNIALRGHDQDNGNFIALLHFQAKHNTILKDHLEKGDPCTKYTSPEIQNELIDLCGEQIVLENVKACNNAPCFGFIADEATDVATMEQMALCVRFYDDATQALREDFLGFAECASTTGESLSTAFLDKLQQLNIDVAKMRGQGYDGAANMSGRARGVQTRIKALYPGAVYTHCRAHTLNLAIIHASKEVYPRNMMDLVQTIAFAFNYSAKRMLCFREHLADNPLNKDEMARRTKLQSLCETRWAARADALYTFLSSFDVVVDALEELGDGGDSKAISYRQGILTFEFIITLIAVEEVLSGLVPLSTMLQKVGCDLLQASVEAHVVVAHLEAIRNDEGAWDTLFGKASELAERVGVDVTVPRQNNRQQNRPNAPATTPNEYWKRNMFLPFVDHILAELRERLLKAHDRFQAQYLIPSQVAQLDDGKIDDIHAAFLPDIEADLTVFSREAKRWRTKWAETEPDDRPKTLEDSISKASVDLYPNVRMCLAVVLSMPVSTASAERSFSTMRRVKTYLRNTMSTGRLSGLGLMNIYREREIRAEVIVDIFARRKPRRLALLFRV